MNWCVSHRFDPAARELADRHYSRQKVGSPQFVRAGSCLVLLSACGRALWVTSWQLHCKHAWAGAWECSTFRSEGAGRASDLIRQAVSCTLAHYGEPPALGMVSMIDRAKVKPTMVRGEAVYGWTWRKAGFVEAGHTKGGLLCMKLSPADMPGAEPALDRSMIGAPLWRAAEEKVGAR